jgi:hypothetical protein
MNLYISSSTQASRLAGSRVAPPKHGTRLNGHVRLGVCLSSRDDLVTEAIIHALPR